jgi:Molybdopterin oxidoreductase
LGALVPGRWAHDKVVRSTHGVNCTGSCSWNVYVKDGLITREAQAVDYPSTGPEMPEYEPRGCPRGASFSWYEYSPLRIKYPYVRGSLLRLFREARRRLGDPVEAWAEIVDDPQKSRVYRRQRGKGGFVRASWDEVVELIAAAHVHTIRRFGPDRCVGFTPIPAMSMASYASGTRFLSLIGGVIRLVAGTSRKRLMGLEPTTFCMASRRQLRGRGRFVPANGALLRRGDESFFPRVSSRFDGIVSPNCPRGSCAAGARRCRARGTSPKSPARMPSTGRRAGWPRRPRPRAAGFLRAMSSGLW